MAPKPAIQMSAARKVEDLIVLTMSTDTKSNAANCVYQRIAVIIVDFSANAAYVYIDYVCCWIKIQIPNVLQQHGARYDLTCVPYQIFEDLEFSRQERDPLSGTIGGARDQIEFEITDSQ